MIHPLSLYADGLLSAAATLGPAQQVRLRDGTLLPVPLERYVGAANHTDEQLLSDLCGPVLDVGCGPGRHLHALAARGVFALGVDLSPVAVALARGRGVRAIVGSIFDELPGLGAWRSAILLDGNIGIGGAPARLLARIGSLLDEDGELLLELDPPETPTMCTLARIEAAHGVSSWFPWGCASIDDVDTISRAGGFVTSARWSREGRWFARLRRRGSAAPAVLKRG